LLLVPACVLCIVGVNWLSLLLFAAAIEALFELVIARRSIQRHAAWGVLLASMRSSRPLAQSLRFHQARFTGIVGRWYRRLVADLDRGVAWPQAAWLNRRALPREAPAYAAAISVAGAVPPESLAMDRPSDILFLQTRQQALHQLAYLASVGAMMAAVVVYIFLRIVPAYDDILADFEHPAPAIYGALSAMAARITSQSPWAWIVPLAAVVVAGASSGVLVLCDVPVLQPVIDRLAMSRHRAHVMRMLALALEHGLPITDSLQRLRAGAGAYPSRVMRRRLATAAEQIAQGGAWQAALERARVISANDAATLRAAQETGNLPWALRLLADRKLRLLAFRWATMQQIAFTLVMLLFGMFVFWIALALFVPLTTTILDLA
jgi:type II secretory pathway component PulF